MPQVGPRCVTQVRQRCLGAPGQTVQRLPLRVRLGIRRQGLLAQAHHLVALGIQLDRLRGMVVGNQQVAAPLDQAHHGIVHVQRDQAALEWAELRVQLRHPRGEERERQRVRHSEGHHVLARAGVRAQHGARVVQALQHLQSLVVQRLAGGGQPRGVGAAIDQIGPRPCLQRLDAPRKRRLRHMAQLRRAAETARFRQADKVL